jgi:N-acetylneuraminic acid mutarotase
VVGCLAGIATTVAVHAQPVVAAALPALPDAHGFAGCFAGMLGPQLIAAGGANFPDGVMPWNGGKKVWHNMVFGLDTTHPEMGWRRLGTLPLANGYGASIQTPQGLVMIGGGDAKTHFTTVRLMQWTDGRLVLTDWPALPAPRANACAALVENRIHLVGGTDTPDATRASNRHFVLDLAQLDQGWTEAAPMPGTGVMLATAAAAGDGLFVIGGCSLAPDAAGKPVRTYLKSGWRFGHDQWTATAELPRAAVGAASPAWTRDGRIYLVGGDDGSQLGGDPQTHPGFTHDILCYDVTGARWTEFAKLPDGLPVTLPGVAAGDAFILVNGEIRPGVRTPAVLKLSIPQP